jgi:tetratricopeptide (TPR) repeat protein
VAQYFDFHAKINFSLRFLGDLPTQKEIPTEDSGQIPFSGDSLQVQKFRFLLTLLVLSFDSFSQSEPQKDFLKKELELMWPANQADLMQKEQRFIAELNAHPGSLQTLFLLSRVYSKLHTLNPGYLAPYRQKLFILSQMHQLNPEATLTFWAQFLGIYNLGMKSKACEATIKAEPDKDLWRMKLAVLLCEDRTSHTAKQRAAFVFENFESLLPIQYQTVLEYINQYYIEDLASDMQLVFWKELERRKAHDYIAGKKGDLYYSSSQPQKALQAYDILRKKGNLSPEQQLKLHMASYVLDKNLGNLRRNLRPFTRDARTAAVSNYFLAVSNLREGNIELARKQLLQALAISPNKTKLFLEATQVYLTLEQPKPLLYILENLPPGVLPPHLNWSMRGDLQFMYLGNLGFAKEAYLNSILLDQNRPEVFDALGQVYAQAEEWPQAKESYLVALKLNPNFEKTYLHLARCYISLGDIAAAKTLANKVIQLNPNLSKEEEYQKLMLLMQAP